jgi:PhnB protein
LPDGDGNIVHASVQNGETMIMFSPCTDDLRSTSGELGKGVSLYLILNDADHVDALFTRAKAAGAKVLQTPKDEFWGDRVWSVADPDGYQLVVCKQVREVSIEDMTRAVSGMATPV